ncbi:ATP-binding protein [Clostridium beijerinckii]|nr:ATP-binding protein [Clostridium beijerinckii]
MPVTQSKMLFYGVDNISEKLDDIINPLNLKKQYFEIKLIIIEAINNAFIHGNNSDKNKPITLRWKFKENLLIVSVTDCGDGVKNLRNHKEINEDNILEECGRGLYIIYSYADEVEFECNSITMKKYIL